MDSRETLGARYDKGENLLEVLCYFSIAEGLRPLLVNWLEVPEPKGEILEEVNSEAPNLWRGFLFSRIITAICWHDFVHKADPALEFFFEVLSRKGVTTSVLPAETPKERDPPLSRLSIRWGVTLLKSELCTGTHSHTDVGLYERFQGFYANYARDVERGRVHQFYMVYLGLYHPAQPDVRRALDFIREEASKAGTKEYNRWAMWGAVDPVIGRFFRRVHELLLRDGRSEDATFVAQQERHMLPPVRSSRPIEIVPRPTKRSSFAHGRYATDL